MQVSIIPTDVISKVISNVDFHNKNYQLALSLIVINPTLWNVVARLEYKYKVFSKITGTPKRACYGLAITIFTLGLLRDYYFKLGGCLEQEHNVGFLDNILVKILGAGCFAVGQTLVLSSMYALGVTGTYLGDYFGLLKDERLTGFPFNACEHPMYDGSSLSFLGVSLYYGSPAGILAAGVVKLVYTIAQKFEGPFTSMIYAKRDEQLQKDKK